MSKERELLERVLDTQHNLSVQIAYEIEELLAQPELSTNSLQLTEQEPVAWMYEEATSFNKDGYFSEWLPCFYLEKADEDKSLRKETPLYTSPQNREPLSDDEIEAIYYDENTSTVYAFARAIEKAHDIGE